MAATVEQLEQRIGVLENAMADLRKVALPSRVDESSAERGKRLLAKAKADSIRIRDVAAKVFADMGITGNPLPVEQLRQLLLAEGARPEENLLSRGIKEIREE